MYVQDGKVKRKAVRMECAYCGKFFWKPIHRLRKTRTKYYCCHDCANMGARSGQQVLCHVCGKEIYRPKWELDRSKHAVYFCSRECQNKGQTILGPEPNCYGQETSDYRSLCSYYYPEIKCNHCLYNDHQPLVEVHHIDSDRSNNNPENLIWLCTRCHRAVTLGLARIEKRKFIWNKT